MNIVMPLYILASCLTIYGTTLQLKAIGYFIQGFLHIKIPVSFAYIYEMIPEGQKDFCSMFINTFDNCTMGVIGIAFLFVTKEATWFLEMVNLFEMAFVILFLALAPESPNWLLLNGK